MSEIANTSIHQFTVNDIDGKPVNLSKYKGKVLLIINTASQCGFTPQLDDMRELYKEFENEDFEILAFPSNDFQGQEPLDGEELKQFCMVKYEAEYPIFEKVHVKGSNSSDLYRFLSDKSLNKKVSSKPKWNFHKYLIDKDGNVVNYYYTITKPTAAKVKKAIRKLL